MRKCLLIIAMIALCVACFMIGRQVGKTAATTADGWMDGDSFVLSIDGDLYEWRI